MSRPRVAICVAASLDGKIATTARDPVTFTSRADRARLFSLRDAADAILVGAGTIRAEDPPLLPSEARRQARLAGGRTACPVRAIVSRSLELPVGRALRPDPASPVVILTPEDAPDAGASRLADAGCRVIRLPEPGFLATALAFLQEDYAVHDVLCEGGGDLNARALAAGLVDRLHLTLCPLILGGANAPTPADGPGFSLESTPRLTLEACESVGDELFLTYRVRPSAEGGGPLVNSEPCKTAT